MALGFSSVITYGILQRRRADAVRRDLEEIDKDRESHLHCAHDLSFLSFATHPLTLTLLPCQPFLSCSFRPSAPSFPLPGSTAG